MEIGVESIDYKENEDKTKSNYNDENLIDYKDFEDVNLKIPYNNILLSDFHLAENPVLKNTISMIEFDIIRSSSFANPTATTINQRFLSSMVNWESRSTRDICAKMPEVDYI